MSDEELSSRIIVGECPQCRRPHRVKARGVKSEMRLNCKCGALNDISVDPDIVAKAEGISRLKGTREQESQEGAWFRYGWKAYLISAAIWVPVSIFVVLGFGAQGMSDLPILVQFFFFCAFFGTAALIDKRTRRLPSPDRPRAQVTPPPKRGGGWRHRRYQRRHRLWPCLGGSPSRRSVACA
jgi:hypothetical protein